MFRLNPEKYKVIRIDYHEDEKWKKDVYAELKKGVKLCLVSGCPYGYVYSQEQKNIHLLYGLEEGEPTKFHIDRKRYECQKCGNTFYADHGEEDFGDNEHTLPEFVKFLIKEWLSNKNESFFTIGKWYSFSRQTVSSWCNMLLSTFDEKTKCEAGKTMVFSSFQYKENGTLRTHAVVCKPMKTKYRVCAFLDDYDKYDIKRLKKTLEERFTKIKGIEKIIYDYFPGINKAMQAFASNETDIIVDGTRLYEHLKTMIKKCDQLEKENLENVFNPTKAISPSEELEELKEWCINLKPESVACVVHEYLWTLLYDTPEHLKNMFYDSDVCADDYMDDITGYCEKRSGKKESYDSMKLRVLYENLDYKKEVLKHLETMTINGAASKKRNRRKKDASSVGCITNYVDDYDITVKKKEKVEYIPASTIDNHNNSEEKSHTISTIDFIRDFKDIDPNEVFAQMPKIRNWSVDVSRLYEVLDDDGDEWLSMED